MSIFDEKLLDNMIVIDRVLINPRYSFKEKNENQRGLRPEGGE